MEKELKEKFYGFHDGIILQKLVDFENKNIEIIIKEFGDFENQKTTKYKLEFKNVEWQNFTSYNTYNGIFEISTYKNYNVFRYNQMEYLEKFEKYITKGTFENIEKNILLKYFYIMSTYGLEGFIICESLNITEIQ